MIATILAFSLGLGEIADYQKASCTSSSVRAIQAKLEVVGESETEFHVDLNYKVRFAVGTKSGSPRRSFDKDFLSQSFINELRDHEYVHADFKLSYLEPDGACHKIRVYDLSDAPGVSGEGTVCPGEPVFGLRAIELKGKHNGVRYRICLDRK